MDPIVHTLSKNFLGITRSYADEVFLPTLAKVAQESTPIETRLLLAGKCLRFVFYTPTLAERMLPAFAHLKETTIEPDLTIHIWDSKETGVELTQPYYKREHMSELGEGTQVALQDGFYGVYFSGEESIQLYDQKSQNAYFWTQDASAIPGWVIGAPLRAILHWYLATVDIQLVHGAVIGIEDEAVLLTAKSGSGKSTTSLASILAGLTYLGDDYVAVSSGQDLIAHMVYNSAKCTTDTLEALPAFIPLAKEIPSVDERKSIIYISQVFPHQTQNQAHLKAILVPTISSRNSDTKIEGISKVETLLAMAPTTIFQLPYTSAGLITKLREIVQRSPCHRLMLGSDIPRTAEAIKNFLEQ